MKNNTFLSDFLLLSDFRTYLFIAVLFMFFFSIRLMEKKKIKFSTRMIFGTISGLILGLIIQLTANFPKDPQSIQWLKETSKWYGLIGNGFMDLLKMLVVPLVFLSIVRVITNMKGNNLKKMTSRSIFMLVGTTLIAASVGIIIANIMKPGSNISFIDKSGEIRTVNTIIDTLRGLIPSNPVAAMAEGNIVAVVIFAAFIGNAIRRLTKKYSDVIEPFVKWIEASYKIILSVAMTIIKFMPYAVIALLADTLISQGINVLSSLIKFIAAIYISLLIMFVIHLIIAMINGISPAKYIKNAFEPLLLAFTSRSSLGTLPVLIETLDKKFGIDEGVATFVGSLGANMGMNGCAGIYPALMTVTLAQITGTEINLSFYIMLAIVIAISSFGIAGLPGSATIAISVVISGMGMESYFPLLGGIIAIDPILDMGRTMINVNGTMISSLTVSNLLKNNSKDTIE